MKNTLGSLAAAVALLLALRAVSAADDKEKKEPPQLVLTTDEQVLFDLMNKERVKAGLKPLKLNPILCKVARGHSANMAKQDKMAHELDGKTHGDRAKAGGYKFAVCGENVGMGIFGVKNQKDWTSVEMMDWWMKSPDHRKSILFTEFTEIGVGIAETKAGKRFFTQLFAEPLD